MNIYLRRIFKHDITHQISVTKEILEDFFSISTDKATRTIKGINSGINEVITFHLKTDPRLGGEVKRLIEDEGGIEIDDILLFTKVKGSYTMEVINNKDGRYNIFKKILEDANDRHAIIHTDSSELFEENLASASFNESSRERNVIVFGAPGTGKSYNLNKEAVKFFEDRCTRITFHPDYTYSQFVGAYKPVARRNERNEEFITYKFVPGPFMVVLAQAMKSKKNGDNNSFLLLIEEINRSNMAAVFGDVFQLLDRRNGESIYSIIPSIEIQQFLSEELQVDISEISEIKIPDNMYIWATMNSADQGVYPMDTAFKRRWEFKYFGVNDGEHKISAFDVYLGKNENRLKINWNGLRKSINDILLNFNINEDKLLGPFFLNLDRLTKDGNLLDENEFLEMFKNKVVMYLFDDAAKHKRRDLFKGSENPNLYSQICDEVDNIGVKIFGDNIEHTKLISSEEDYEDGQEP